jgi:hypothetical protein
VTLAADNAVYACQPLPSGTLVVMATALDLASFRIANEVVRPMLAAVADGAFERFGHPPPRAR